MILLSKYFNKYFFCAKILISVTVGFDQKKSIRAWNGLSSIVNLSILRTQNICVNNIWQLSMNTLAYIIKLYEKIHLITTVVKKYVIKFCRRHAITKTSQNDVLWIKKLNFFTLGSIQSPSQFCAIELVTMLTFVRQHEVMNNYPNWNMKGWGLKRWFLYWTFLSAQHSHCHLVKERFSHLDQKKDKPGKVSTLTGYMWPCWMIG